MEEIVAIATWIGSVRCCSLPDLIQWQLRLSELFVGARVAQFNEGRQVIKRTLICELHSTTKFNQFKHCDNIHEAS